jgi:Bacteriophage tail sheath protein
MTPDPQHPGVFVEEVPTGVRTITGVSTSIAAFIGAASRGRSYRAVRINSFGEFEQRFGGLIADHELGYAVQQFFLNGGKDAWVVRVSRQLTAAKVIKGIHALDAVDIFNVLVIPAVTNSEALFAAADYCKQRRAFLILDAPKSAQTPTQMEQAVQNASLPKTSYGAFQGRTPRDAYFVKCDATTTTQNDIDTGLVNVVIGFAPLKPAEFIILTISTKAGRRKRKRRQRHS